MKFTTVQVIFALVCVTGWALSSPVPDDDGANFEADANDLVPEEHHSHGYGGYSGYGGWGGGYGGWGGYNGYNGYNGGYHGYGGHGHHHGGHHHGHGLGSNFYG